MRENESTQEQSRRLENLFSVVPYLLNDGVNMRKLQASINQDEITANGVRARAASLLEVIIKITHVWNAQGLCKHVQYSKKIRY